MPRGVEVSPPNSNSHLLMQLWLTRLLHEEKKAQDRVEARKQRNKQKGPVEGKAGKQDDFVLRPTYDAIGRELISLVADTLRLVSRIYGKPDQG